MSAWGADGKVGRDYRVRVGRPLAEGGEEAAAATLQCLTVAEQKKLKNLPTVFATTKHHSEIKDVQEQLTEYTIQSFILHKSSPGKMDL